MEDLVAEDNLIECGDFDRYEKTGYLTEPYKIFHLRECKEQQFDFHYHDFYKIIYFVDGRVDYKVEGKTYHWGNASTRPQKSWGFPTPAARW